MISPDNSPSVLHPILVCHMYICFLVPVLYIYTHTHIYMYIYIYMYTHIYIVQVCQAIPNCFCHIC